MNTIFYTDGILANSVSSAEHPLEYFVSAESRLTLETLRMRGVRIGVIVNAQDLPLELREQALEKSGLLVYLDPQLIIYSDGFTDEALQEAASRSQTDRPALFVGEHCDLRRRALDAGFQAAIPHPNLVSEVMDGWILTYACVSQIDGKDGKALIHPLWQLPVVPVYLDGERGTAYIITSTRVAAAIKEMGLEVTSFGSEHDPQVTDLYLVHDDRPVPAESNALEYSFEFLAQRNKDRFIVTDIDGALLLALPREVAIEEIHFPGAMHGHNRRLIADTCLAISSVNGTAGFPVDPEPQPKTALQSTLSKTELKVLTNFITDTSLRELHEPYIGAAPLYGSQHWVTSRHVSHPDNAKVTQALCQHLTDIGQGVMAPAKRHNFYLGDKLLSNIECELPGSDPSSIVIISAHFDSTAKSDGVFDPAPGADDDASGVAAVLAAANVAVALRAHEQFRRTLRFVLFNAEEDKIYGSQQYAKYQVANHAQLFGVFQMDMIGHSGGSVQKEFEAHIGYARNHHVEIKSEKLTQLIVAATPQVSNLNPPQVYPDTLAGHDPSDGRSDHTSFHACGFAACLVSEDSHEGPKPNSPPPRPNCDYHRTSDRKIDYKYAAEIARVVTAAAILAAKS